MTEGGLVEAVDILNPEARSSLVLSVAHGGVHVPQWCRSGLLVPVEDLWSDWDTAELYDVRDLVDAPIVRTRLSRFVADANRAPLSPLRGTFWRAAIPTSDPAGVNIYDRELDAGELERRLAAAHHPFHRALDRVIGAALADREKILLLDLHSFGVPLAADVVVGDVGGTSASATAAARVEASFTRTGFAVARNLRFTGGYIVRRYVADGRVDAVQIEINQRCYLNESGVEAARPRPTRDAEHWNRTRAMLVAAFQSLAATVPVTDPPRGAGEGRCGAR